MEPEARPSPSPSPSPHRSSPPTMGAADGPRAEDPRPPLPPPLAPQMQQQEKEKEQEQEEKEKRAGGGDWPEEPLSPTPPLPISSAADTVFVSHAAQYVPPRAAERAAVDPGRGGYGGDAQSWYSWNGGRSKDRRRATPPASARMQPQPQPQPHPRAHPEPKPRPHPRATPPPPLPVQPRVEPPPVRVPMPMPPLSPAPVPASAVDRDLRYVPDVMTRKRRTAALQRTALVARAAAAVLCLAALAVLAADSRKGWALDSYSNYTQFRYSEAVNVIGFLYSVFQFFALAAHLRSNRHLIPRPKGDYFDFTMDQVLAYLLISSSSSATAATGDWIDNWGSDPFPNMANSSIAISFMAFVVFAINSLISAYNLFRRDL